MSAAKRMRLRNKQFLESKNRMKPQQKINSANTFEELQLLNLQAVINYLALQIQAEMMKKENKDQQLPLPVLRTYAQYLNLYMKFKDKCFHDSPVSQQQAVLCSEPETTQQFTPEKNTPSNGNPTMKFQDGSNQECEKSKLNQLHQINNTSALLMPPPDKSKSEGMRFNNKIN